MQSMPPVQQLKIPPNVTGALADFLTTQAKLSNARAQIHNRLLDALPNEVTVDQPCLSSRHLGQAASINISLALRH